VLVKRLKETKARLVWASTTPIPDDPSQKQTAASIIERNQAAAEVMQRHNIPVDDLFADTAPHVSEYQLPPPNVHFKEAGYDFLGQQVAAAILAQLEGARRSGAR
jgi:lysophospholipase L1-like esterase